MISPRLTFSTASASGRGGARLGLACLLLATACSTTESGTGTGASVGSGTTGAGSGGATSTTGAGTQGTGAETGGTGGTGSTGTTGGGPGSGSASGGTTAGDGPAPQCESPSDCKLVNDCCTCAVLPATDPAPDCPAQECFAPACDAAQYKGEAVCEAGLCRFTRASCDPSGVVCLAPSPTCPEGFLPEVEGQCWSGACVPVAACDWAPGCEACGEELLCVIEQTQSGPVHRCEPTPWECGDGPADCACAGQLCLDPYDTCAGGQGAPIECSCPDC